MTEPVLSRVAEARTFLSKLWKLAAPYWWAEGTAEIGVGRFRFTHGGALDRARPAAGHSVPEHLHWSTSASCSTTGTAASTTRCRTRTRTHSGSRFAGSAFSGVSSTSSWPYIEFGCANICRSAGDAGSRASTFADLARRQHLLPHGADRSRRRQSRAADREDIARIHQEHALSDSGFHLRGDLAGDLLGASCGIVGYPGRAPGSAAWPFRAT